MSLPAFGKQPPGIRSILTETLEDDICGRLLEDIVFLTLSKEFSGGAYDVSKYRDAAGGEYDVVVKDPQAMQAAVLEVKHAKTKHESQRRHMVNAEMEQEFTEQTGYAIREKCVLYNGPTEPGRTDGIRYVNVSEFLTDTDGFLQQLFAGHASPGEGQDGQDNAPEEHGDDTLRD
jgi:predicted AAA+ superfamily ATPase